MDCSQSLPVAGAGDDSDGLPIEYPKIEMLHSPVGDFMTSLGRAERQQVRNAVEQRRREYSTGRWLARQGLARLGIKDFELLSGPHREPLWPEGVVGSITHSRQTALVAIAWRRDYLSVGVDIEQKDRIEVELVAKLLTFRERQIYGDADPTLLFSAKESVHKLLFPMYRRHLDFLDVDIELDMQGQRFWPRFSKDPDISRGLSGLEARFRSYRGHWLTFTALANGEAA